MTDTGAAHGRGGESFAAVARRADQGPIANRIAVAPRVRHVGDHTLHRRAQKIRDNFRTIATAAALSAAMGSIYTGVRALIGEI
jgi:hypothetical protein